MESNFPPFVPKKLKCRMCGTLQNYVFTRGLKIRNKIVWMFCERNIFPHFVFTAPLLLSYFHVNEVHFKWSIWMQSSTWNDFSLGTKKMKCNDEEKVQICAKQQTLRRDFTNYRHAFQTTKDTKTKRNRTQRRAEMNDSPRDVCQCINHREKRSNTNAHGLKLKRKLNESKSPWWRKLICGKEGVTVRELMFRAVTDAERRRIVRRCLCSKPTILFVFKRLKRAASAGVLIKNILKSKQSELRPTERCDVD